MENWVIYLSHPSLYKYLDGAWWTIYSSMIEVSCPSCNRVNQGEPSMAWLLFQYICLMYCNIKNRKSINTAMLLTSISKNTQANK